MGVLSSIKIVGEGVFGKFLQRELRELVDFSEDAEIVILAVPASAYEEVAKEHAGKHLVNVCSVQDQTNKICWKYSARVTGIHPMFGPRSPREGRSCLVTYESEYSSYVIGLFEQIGCEIVREANGVKIDGKLHDLMMAKTHLPVLLFGQMVSLIVERAKGIPDNCLPTSFKRLKALADQMSDMPSGTVESIKSNPYG